MLRILFALVAAVLAFNIGNVSGSVTHAAAQQLPFTAVQLPEWTVTASPYGGKLLFSDSPETVNDVGIMYQDIVTGSNRLFFHHVNGTSTAKKIVAIVENNGSEPAHLTVSQYGLGGPGYDYLAVGKKAQLDYLNGGDLYLLEVPEHGAAELALGLSGQIVEPNMLVNGIYDFTTDKPVTVKVMMMPVDADFRQFAKHAKILPADEYRLRGTFDGKDRLIIPDRVYNPKEHGFVAITLADNDIDRYLVGVDATDGSKVINYGNYGVVYKLFIPSVYEGKLSVYLNPRGGTYAGGLGVKYRHQQLPTVATPANTLFFGTDTVKDYAKIGTYDGGQSLWFTFSPPGASNLPVKLIIGNQ